ncbi:acyl-CoA desaturase, partial [Williamsia sp.]|uniref:fatty acid desaturase family protein n=1 Tax=Williamsia sp. TaxID=1872085 RepID=UPI001A27075E
QVDALGASLDAIRADIESSRGIRDADYIRRTILAQRAGEVIARLILLASRRRSTWLVGTGLLATSKVVENMELGHNISHGQWDWMNDPEIHSATWEWDQVGPSDQWRLAHNREHHVYTNIVGMDHDLGFGILRMSRDIPWTRTHLLQPLANVILALTFEWGIALHDHAAQVRYDEDRPSVAPGSAMRSLIRKARRQMIKDFGVFPLLAGRRRRSVLAAGLAANVVRNLWSYLVIFCGHFPDGAETFTADTFDTETRAEWYLRQMLGSANFHAGPVLAVMSGHLCYQIEHHLFPDLPCNRYAEIARQVRALCADYDLPYTTGSLPRQYLRVLATLHRLSLPDTVRGSRQPLDEAA